MLTYYSTTTHADFWTEHWGRHGLAELLAVARVSPLTRLITDALPPAGVVLEAGCGLGQYVVLLRERGWCAMGVDASLDALTTCRRGATVPLAASDLRALAIARGTVAAYVSLGVVEHDRDGPDAILAEAHRVLQPGGVLIISVPYLNGVRRLGAPWIRRRQVAVHRRGGAFYQYVFSRPEFLGALRGQGFEPLAAHPYDPARLLRSALGRLRPRRSSTHARPPAGAPSAGLVQRDGTRPWLARAVRAVLYSEPGLRLLGHMLLVVARRP